ncbi:hypothetical protein [Brevibacillus invocatus]|uniref:hypothetical protein n=1 Tax=Brevibacillus invocatus TaxID=173959 RepID=UPI00267AE963
MSFKQMICDVSTGVCGEAGESNFQTFEWNQPLKKAQAVLRHGPYLLALLGA